MVPIAFERLSEADAAAVLTASGLEGPEASALARWSAGAPGVALRLAERGAPQLRDLVLGVARGETQAARASAAVWEVEGDFPGKTPAAQRRLRAETLLDIGLELWHDLERRLAGAAPESLPHGALVEGLPQAPGPVREARLEAWLTARQDVALNLSPEALIDRALTAAAPR